MFGRSLTAIAIALLCAASVAAQSLAASAARPYEGPAGPWISKYVAATPGTAAPELTVAGWLNRQPTTLRRLRNQTVLIYFWATWCAACPDGLAKLQRLVRSMPDPIEVITVRLPDQDAPRAASGIFTTLPVAVDQGTIARAYGVKAVPACVLVDPQGFIRFVHIRLPTINEINAVSGLLPQGGSQGDHDFHVVGAAVRGAH